MKSFLISFALTGVVCFAVWKHWRTKTEASKTGLDEQKQELQVLPNAEQTTVFAKKSLRVAQQAWKPFASEDSRKVAVHADHWAMLDAVSAEDIATWAKTLKKDYYDRRWKAVMMRWASLDGRAAVAHAQAEEWNYDSLMAEMLACWLRSDFAGASEEIAHMRVSGDWAPAFATLAQVDIGKALDVTAREIKNAKSENNEFSWPGHPGYHLAEQMRDPARKAAFLRWLEIQTDPNLAMRIFSIVYSQMDHDAGWLRPENLPDYMPGKDRLPQTLEHPDSVWAMGAIAEGQNPFNALRDRDNAPHPEHTDAPKSYSVAQRLYHWAKKDPESAGTWLLAQEVTPDLDEAIRGYAGAVMYENPAAAVKWAARLSDAGERVRGTADYYGRWYREDPIAAQAWLAGAGFSEIQRNYIAGRAVIGR